MPTNITWTITRTHYPKAFGQYVLSSHAWKRMCSRGLSPEVIRRALRYGRVIFARGAVHFVLGRNEVERYDAVRPGDNGIQIVVTELGTGTVVTIYRNREELPRS